MKLIIIRHKMNQVLEQERRETLVDLELILLRNVIVSHGKT